MVSIHNLGPFLSLCLESPYPLAGLLIGDVVDLHCCRTLNQAHEKACRFGGKFYPNGKCFYKYALAVRDHFFPEVAVEKAHILLGIPVINSLN